MSVDALMDLCDQAAALLREIAPPCHDGHDWESVGGRGCTKELDVDCSQTVFQCRRCNAWDYGERGGPGHMECETHCRHGLIRYPARDIEPPEEA